MIRSKMTEIRSNRADAESLVSGVQAVRTAPLVDATRGVARELDLTAVGVVVDEELRVVSPEHLATPCRASPVDLAAVMCALDHAPLGFDDWYAFAYGDGDPAARSAYQQATSLPFPPVYRLRLRVSAAPVSADEAATFWEARRRYDATSDRGPERPSEYPVPAKVIDETQPRQPAAAAEAARLRAGVQAIVDDMERAVATSADGLRSTKVDFVWCENIQKRLAALLGDAASLT